MLLYLVVRCVILWRNRSAANKRSCLTSLFAILFYVPSFNLITDLNVRGMPLPKPGLPDPQSGEMTMRVVFGFVGAYVAAFILVQFMRLWREKLAPPRQSSRPASDPPPNSN